MPLDPCDPEYKYFGLTVVRYRSDALLGVPMALLTLSPIFLAVAYLTLLLTRREIPFFLFLFGQGIDLLCNKVLKAIPALYQARPEGCPNGGSGFPSNHAQFMAYFATFTALWIYRRASAHTLLNGGSDNRWVRGGAACLLFSWAAAVGYSRIYLACHTLSQVCSGGSIGACMAIGWYVICEKLLLPHCPRLSRSKLARLLRVATCGKEKGV